MELILNVLEAIGESIASFWADHPLAAAIVTIIAIAIFWRLMGWENKPDLSDQAKVIKNGLLVLLGWAIAIPILDFFFTIISKIFDGAEIAGSGLVWLWERFNEQPFVVLICLLIAFGGFWVWGYVAKEAKILTRALTSLLAFIVFVGIAVPIANQFTEEDKNSSTDKAGKLMHNTVLQPTSGRDAAFLR